MTPAGMRRWILGILAAWLAAFPPPAPGAEVRLAIPAFENLTGDGRLDWIGEGFARTLAEKLNRIAGVSAAGIKARGLFSPDREIDAGRLLAEAGPTGADTVLFGSVVKGADVDRLDEPLEVVLRVVDLRTTRQQGSLELVGRMRDLFAMEADLAGRAAAVFGVRLSPAEEEALRTQETRSLQAYKETVLGTIYLEDGKYDPAIAMLEQAMTHHPGIFYPKAHTQLAEAYARSGRKEEMLRRMKKDAAAVSGVYFQLAAAQEFNGQPEEAAKNYALFLKYTDRRATCWKRALPRGMYVRGADERWVWLANKTGTERLLVLPADGTGEPAAAPTPEPSPPTASMQALPEAIPNSERPSIRTSVLQTAGRLYYGLENGFLVGRETRGGRRVWAYRTAATPTGNLALAAETLVAQDDRGTLYRLGLHEGPEPSDVSAYLRLAQLARRRNHTADAEGIYRYIVEEVKPNEPEAWHGLWELARAAGNERAAGEAWRRYEESRF